MTFGQGAFTVLPGRVTAACKSLKKDLCIIRQRANFALPPLKTHQLIDLYSIFRGDTKAEAPMGASPTVASFLDLPGIRI